MWVLLTGFSAAAGIFRFIVLFLVFIGVLVAAFYFTRWYAKSGLVKRGPGNIQVVETYQFAPGKVIYIVKIGSRFVSIMTSKDNIVKLMELSEDEIKLVETQPVGTGTGETSFKEVMGNMMKNRKMKDGRKKDGK